MTLTVRPLVAQDWPEAVRLAARAMADYGYVHALFGDDPLDRLAGTAGEFLRQPWDPRRTASGAFAGDLMVGFARGWWGCSICDDVPEPAPDASAVEIAEAAFEAARHASHEGLPTHGHVGPVMVEPGAHGLGVGSRVVRDLLERLDALDAKGRPLVLECVRGLEPFYSGLGFATVTTFMDSTDDGTMLTMARPSGPTNGHPSAPPAAGGRTSR